MRVCGHGDVDAFCKKKGMIIHTRYKGDIADYDGKSGVLVTDAMMGRTEYLQLKTLLCLRGSDLILTRGIHGGRYKFGFDATGMTDVGRRVVARILELKDADYTLGEIREDEGVFHPGGRKMSLSTIHKIIVDREFYEKEGL